MNAIMKGVITTVGVPDYQKIHGMMLNQDGTLSNYLPHFSFIFNYS